MLAFYEAGGTRVGVEVTDLVHVCSCSAGMGATLQRRRVDAGAASSSVSDHPAARGEGPELEVWVNDRCSVRVWAAPADVLNEVSAITGIRRIPCA